MDQLDPCREILSQIHSKRQPIAGGSGKRPRYEMRDTALYFKLGTELLRIVEGKDDQKALTRLARDISTLQREFDDSTNVFHWSIRFVRAFQNEEYFGEVSQICHLSFGQLREVVEILDRHNPLSISNPDLESFRTKMRGPVTYEDVRKICMELKAKYLGEVPSIDVADVRDVFDVVEFRVINLIQDPESSHRQTWRQEVGIDKIEAVRHVLMLLSREEVLEKVTTTKPRILSALSRDIHSPDSDLDTLYHFLLEFLKSGKSARNHIRKTITPLEMGQLQTMMKALTSEAGHAAYARTEHLFSELNL